MGNARNLGSFLGTNTSLSTINDAYDAGALSNRNLIINGEFLISQRGDYTSATSLSNNTYYLDRFINRNGVAGTIQQTSNMPTGQTGKSVKMLTTASGTAQFVLEQFIEPQTWMTSKTYTASCWIKSNSNKCSITLINNGNFADRVSHTGGGDWEKITLTFNIGSTLSDFRIRIGLSQGGNTSISSGDYFEFTQLQLEVGDTATPFEHRLYGDELAKCQRYFELLDYSGSVGNAISNSMQWSGTTDQWGNIMYKYPKRVTPSGSVSGSVIIYGKGNISSATTPTLQYISKVGLGIRVQPSSFTSDVGFIGNSSNFKLSVDAEL